MLKIKKISVSIFLFLMLLSLNGCYKQNKLEQSIQNTLKQWEEDNFLQIKLIEKNYNNELINFTKLSIASNTLSFMDYGFQDSHPIYYNYDNNDMLWAFTKKENKTYKKVSYGETSIKNFTEIINNHISYCKLLIYFSQEPDWFKFNLKKQEFQLLAGNTQIIYPILHNGYKLDKNDTRKYKININLKNGKISTVLINDPFVENGHIIFLSFYYEKINIDLPIIQEEVLK